MPTKVDQGTARALLGRARKEDIVAHIIINRTEEPPFGMVTLSFGVSDPNNGLAGKGIDAQIKYLSEN